MWYIYILMWIRYSRTSHLSYSTGNKRHNTHESKNRSAFLSRFMDLLYLTRVFMLFTFHFAALAGFLLRTTRITSERTWVLSVCSPMWRRNISPYPHWHKVQILFVKATFVSCTVLSIKPNTALKEGCF